MRTIGLATIALVAGCAPCVATTSSPTSGGCSTEHARDLVGFLYGEGLAEQAMSRTGARIYRVIRPGQAVTMDYREDRVNIHLDAGGRVTSVSCG